MPNPYSLILRNEKGSALTHNELDNNFNYFDYSVSGLTGFTINVNNCVLIGANASGGGFSNSIVFGAFTPGSDNQLILGDIGEIYIGNGYSNSSPRNPIVITTTRASGNNVNGSDLYLEGGFATGSGAGGDVGITTTKKGSSGSSTQSSSNRMTALGKYIVLTEGVATTFATVNSITDNENGGQMILTVRAKNSTNFQSRTLSFVYTTVKDNSSNSYTTLSTPIEAFAESPSGGTLTVTVTTQDAGGGIVNFQATATSSLSQTTLDALVQVYKNFGDGVSSP